MDDDALMTKTGTLKVSPTGTINTTPKTLRKVTLAASVGSAIEYFELVIYGAMAPYLSHVFFPSDDPTAALLSTFIVFAIAFFARPLGGLIWGPIGDRVGRKKALVAIIILMSISTAVIGLLPGYETIGVFAPILLVLMRLLQGISAGGEMPGAATLVGEYAPNDRRGLQTSFLHWGVVSGQILALLTGAALALTIPAEDMNEWGWRLPFLMAIPLGIIALIIRSKVDESPVFERLAAMNDEKVNPLRELLGTKRGWKMLGRTAFINLPASVPAYMLMTFMPAFLQNNEGFGAWQSLMAVLAGVLFTFIFIPISGTLSDRLGRRRILFGLCVLQLVLAWPAFALLTSGNAALAVFGLMLLGTMNGSAIGAQSAPLLETFPTSIRYSGYALALGLSTALIAGPTPYVATWMVSASGSDMAPMWLIIACAIPSLIGAFFIRETARKPLLTDKAPETAP
ncbi:MFS transporter [Microbacterium sp. ISL-103]|uniref:MFS transporter n=1 Tax=Microbacterium sp. ISL-103 TaxID=2819156 RepID=UPI001BED0EBC|nr:MFS transporter [Microbacterium sp. ISL-103]MBT2473651.1 MFS transporter [Microbacterium sp. ISL-103]